MAKLTKKQEKFIDEYMIDLNASRAYKAAFCCQKDTTARTEGSKLLAKPNVQEELDARLEQMRQRYKGIKEKIIERNLNIINCDVSKIVKTKKVQVDGMMVDVVDITPTDELTDEQRSCIKTIKQTRDGITIEFEDKSKAEETLNKMLGLDKDSQVDVGVDTSAISHLSTEDLIAALNKVEDDK